MNFQNPLSSNMNNNNSQRFNPNSKEFVPFMGSSTPRQNNNSNQTINPEEMRLRKLAKQLNSLGVLDDDSTSDHEDNNTTNTKNEDSGVFQQPNPVSKSPVKSHNSSASSGIGNSLVSSLRMMAEQSTTSGFDDQKTISKTITVPSSEHVAEIVGKQGCKIKALRSKTNTYIKTPVRGEDPNFVITGHRNDVESAVREIQEAADHFTMIRQQRSRQHFDFVQKSGDSSRRVIEEPKGVHPLSKSGNLPFMQDRGDFISNRSSSPKNNDDFNIFEKKSNTDIFGQQKDGFSGISMWGKEEKSQSSRSNTPEMKKKVVKEENVTFGGYTLDSFDPDLLAKQITLKVRVPYNVVGLVVGPKGATIKRIQTTTQTYIVTPSKDKEPVFEVTGLPENAERAREEIQSHIATRTGADQLDPDEEFKLNGQEADLPELDLTESTNKTNNNSLMDPFTNPRPLKSVTPPGFDEKPSLDIFGTKKPDTMQKSAISPGGINLFTNPLREAFESPIGEDEIKKLTIDDDVVEEEFEKNNALEALQNLSAEEKVKLGEVIEKMKREKAEQKKIQDENKMNSIFEPESLAKQKPAPSIDNVLIGKATPGPSNPIPQQHRRAHIDHPSQFSHHPGVTDSRHFRGHSPQFGYNQGYSRGYDNYHHGYYPPQHHYDRYNQGPPRGYYDSHHEMSYDPRRQNYGNKMMPYQSNEHVQPAGPPTVPGVNRAGKCLVCREKQITMALVPCGHNLFCEECAMRITHGNKNSHANPVCPECFEPVNMAIRIKM